MDIIKTVKFCASKGTINRVKRQPTEWEKIFANDLSDRQLIPRIYKELLQLNEQPNPNKLIQKWAKDLNRHIPKEGTPKHGP